jgi:hypothetical protein
VGTSRQAGDWNDPNTWTGLVVPSTTENSTITHAVTITTPVTAGDGTGNAINVASGGYLRVKNDLTLVGRLQLGHATATIHFQDDGTKAGSAPNIVLKNSATVVARLGVSTSTTATTATWIFESAVAGRMIRVACDTTAGGGKGGLAANNNDSSTFLSTVKVIGGLFLDEVGGDRYAMDFRGHAYINGVIIAKGCNVLNFRGAAGHDFACGKADGVGAALTPNGKIIVIDPPNPSGLTVVTALKVNYNTDRTTETRELNNVGMVGWNTSAGVARLWVRDCVMRRHVYINSSVEYGNPAGVRNTKEEIFFGSQGIGAGSGGASIADSTAGSGGFAAETGWVLRDLIHSSAGSYYGALSTVHFISEDTSNTLATPVPNDYDGHLVDGWGNEDGEEHILAAGRVKVRRCLAINRSGTLVDGIGALSCFEDVEHNTLVSPVTLSDSNAMGIRIAESSGAVGTAPAKRIRSNLGYGGNMIGQGGTSTWVEPIPADGELDYNCYWGTWSISGDQELRLPSGEVSAYSRPIEVRGTVTAGAGSGPTLLTNPPAGTQKGDGVAAGSQYGLVTSVDGAGAHIGYRSTTGAPADGLPALAPGVSVLVTRSYFADGKLPGDAGWGAHDVAFDPQFVDPSWTLKNYAAAQGITDGDAREFHRQVLIAELGYDETGAAQTANSSFTVPSILAAAREAFRPQNPLLATAAHDGGTIGAVPYVASGPSDPAPSAPVTAGYTMRHVMRFVMPHGTGRRGHRR